MTSIPNALIARALQKILASPIFAVSGILKRFLSFVVDETLQGRANQIKEYTIGVHVLDKPAGFKPQQDAIVRIHGGRLRRALHQYYMHDGAEDPIRIGIPKGGYVPVFESNMQVADSLVAPAFSNQLPTRKANGRIPKNKQDTRIVVAVMPFTYSENNRFNKVFAKNLVEQLNTDLSQFQEIQVIGQYCAQQVTSKKNNFTDLHQGFSAQYMITGHIQEADHTVRCCVQLISTKTSEQIWSKVYNMELESGQLQVQDDIVRSVLTSLSGYYGVIVRDVAKTSEIMHLRDSAKHESILWYYYFHAEFTEHAFSRSMRAMECAVRRNPSDSFAWAFLGELHLSAFFFTQRVNTHASALARRYAQKSLAINPQSAQGYITLGWANLLLGNQGASVECFENALGLTSFPTTSLGHIGFGLICSGNYEQGFLLMDKTIGQNLFYPKWFNLGISLFYFKSKHYALAIEWATKVNYPHIAWDKLIIAAALAHLNRKKEATVFMRKLVKQVPNLPLLISQYGRILPFDPAIREDLEAGLRKASVATYAVASAGAKKVAKTSVTFVLN